MWQTFKLLLFGENQHQQEIDRINQQIQDLEVKARAIEREEKRIRMENHLTPKLEWIFSRGAR